MSDSRIQLNAYHVTLNENGGPTMVPEAREMGDYVVHRDLVIELPFVRLDPYVRDASGTRLEEDGHYLKHQYSDEIRQLTGNIRSYAEATAKYCYDVAHAVSQLRAGDLEPANVDLSKDNSNPKLQMTADKFLEFKQTHSASEAKQHFDQTISTFHMHFERMQSELESMIQQELGPDIQQKHDLEQEHDLPSDLFD